MFKRNLISMLMLGIFLSASAAAFADSMRTLSLPGNLVLQGKRLQAGEYTITWYHHSPRLTVKIANGKKVLVTASAKLVEWNKAYDRDTIAVSTRPDGTKALRAIIFAGSGQAIVFDAQQERETPFLLPYSYGEAGYGPGAASNGARKHMAR